MIVISIHLMLWFNHSKPIGAKVHIKFQYILCCGSTISVMFRAFRALKFQYILCCGSTLYVHARNMYGIVFQYILCCGSTVFADNSISKIIISIHLMLWFNWVMILVFGLAIAISIHLMLWFNQDKKQNQKRKKSFQYILCCGSTSFKFNFWRDFFNFNTSYVVVQRSCWY